mmetsp:Transcript_4887/g.15086  ORF Transcript_4887/g.15086 Transcript_4887/m.15086 type:complete len:277 (-) Transcript_4887:7-837(-)
MLAAEPAAVPGALPRALLPVPVPEVVVCLHLCVLGLLCLPTPSCSRLPPARGCRGQRPWPRRRRRQDSRRLGAVPPRAPGSLLRLRAPLRALVGRQLHATAAAERRELRWVLRADAPTRIGGACRSSCGARLGQCSGQGKEHVDGSRQRARLGCQALNQRRVQGREHGRQPAAAGIVGHRHLLGRCGLPALRSHLLLEPLAAEAEVEARSGRGPVPGAGHELGHVGEVRCWPLLLPSAHARCGHHAADGQSGGWGPAQAVVDGRTGLRARGGQREP